MTRAPQRTRTLIVFALASALPAEPGLAELGGSDATVQADQSRLHAMLRRIPLATHIRHELTLPNGAVVHEYSNPQGQVFAIRWSGPGKPDLRSLLGSRFAALQAANTGRSGRFGKLSRRTVTLDRSDLKIESGGHMGYFWGLAWLPELMPPGVEPGDLQ